MQHSAYVSTYMYNAVSACTCTVQCSECTCTTHNIVYTVHSILSYVECRYALYTEEETIGLTEEVNKVPCHSWLVLHAHAHTTTSALRLSMCSFSGAASHPAAAAAAAGWYGVGRYGAGRYGAAMNMSIQYLWHFRNQNYRH